MLIEEIKQFIKKDKYITSECREDVRRSQQWIAIIASVGFAVMSLLNIKQHSIPMLVSTGSASIVLLLAWLYSLWKKNSFLIRMGFYAVLLLIFPAYVIRGGNDGFAALWLVILTYLTMYFLDLVVGFLINSFYFLMLIGLFIGPFTFVPTFEYNATFKLRFPFFYLINFAFSVYFIVNIRTYQYNSMISAKELERQSITDLNTGVYNRNAFIRYLQDFNPAGIDNLSFIYIDANGLHELNNAKGHIAGDRMLKCIASECSSAFPQDSVYRLGGDEFLVACVNTDQKVIRSRMDDVILKLAENGYTISFGIETAEGPDFDPESICNRANKSMIAYKAAFYKNKAHDRREVRS